eukprot:scaffold13088_cov56-Phaeocystis_antarctica.AAC.2
MAAQLRSAPEVLTRDVLLREQDLRRCLFGGAGGGGPCGDGAGGGRGGAAHSRPPHSTKPR